LKKKKWHNDEVIKIYLLRKNYLSNVENISVYKNEKEIILDFYRPLMYNGIENGMKTFLWCEDLIEDYQYNLPSKKIIHFIDNKLLKSLIIDYRWLFLNFNVECEKQKGNLNMFKMIVLRHFYNKLKKNLEPGELDKNIGLIKIFDHQLDLFVFE